MPAAASVVLDVGGGGDNIKMLNIGEKYITLKEVKNKMNLHNSVPCKPVMNTCYKCHSIRHTCETIQRPITLVRLTDDSKVISPTRESH